MIQNIFPNVFLEGLWILFPGPFELICLVLIEELGFQDVDQSVEQLVEKGSKEDENY